MAASTHDWTVVQPEKRWFVLSKQKRFAMWAFYASLGSMTMGMLISWRKRVALTLAIGFDWGIAGTATAFPAFQKTMGIPYPSQPSGYLIPAHVSQKFKLPATKTNGMVGPSSLVRSIDVW